MSASLAPGAAAQLLSCEDCALLSRVPAAPTGRLRCPRCRAPLHRRKPNSLNRSWALLIAAAILYIPANVFPVLSIEILGKTEADTILGGVAELFQGGMWEIGALIFFASIAVPGLKIGGMTLLLISVQRRWQWRPRDRTAAYRII